VNAEKSDDSAQSAGDAMRRRKRPAMTIAAMSSVTAA
jgi:hypothetical protein